MGLSEDRRPTSEELRPFKKPLGASRTYERNEHGRGFKTDGRGHLVPRPHLDVADAVRIGKAIERRHRRAQKRKGGDDG